MNFSHSARLLGAATIAAGLVAVAAGPASAHTVYARHGKTIAHAHTVTAINYSEGRSWRHSRYDRRYNDRVVHVDAPFTTVETRRYRYTAVDAPFASVRVHGRGVWVRAPFVNLYVPR